MTDAQVCGFCPISHVERYGPNTADTTIAVASGHEFPICTDCLMHFHESLYNDWLAQQQPSMGNDPRDTSVDHVRLGYDK